LADKLERTYGYIVRTWREIEQLKQHIISLTHQVAKQHAVDTVYFFGPDDDFAAILSDLMRSESFSVRTQLIHDCEQLRQLELKTAPVIVWSEEVGHQLTILGCSWINIVSLLHV
jgi:hypothetical protein